MHYDFPEEKVGVATQPLPTPKPITIPPYYQKNEYSRTQVLTEPSFYWPHGMEYAKKHGWDLTPSVFESIQHRSEGRKFLSYREADIAGRGRLLEESMVVGTLLGPFENFLTEDIVGLKDSIYELRLIYNRGVEYRKKDYQRQPLVQKQKCDAYMASLEAIFAKNRLSPWPEEKEQGFALGLCRPEYMTLDQYRAKNQQFETFLVDLNGDRVPHAR